MQEAVKTDEAATARETHYYARLAAFINFVNDVDTGMWRKHCKAIHGAHWIAEWERREAQGMKADA